MTLLVVYTGVVVRVARIETKVEAMWTHVTMLRILVFLVLLLALVTLAWGGEEWPSPERPTWGTEAPPRIWTPEPYRDPRAGDSLLRSPLGVSTGRSLLAPPPIYRPMPFPDQRGRPLNRER